MLLVVAAIAAALLSPPERTLGVSGRLVYYHGAWVWAGLTVFGAAGLAGLAAVLSRRKILHDWSRVSAWTGLTFWLIYLPMSLLVMQLNWNGLYLDEPRWRIPFSFAVIGILLQLGLWLIRQPVLTSLANLTYAAALYISLFGAENILHPDAPVRQSGSLRIQGFFMIMLGLDLMTAFVLAVILRRIGAEKKRP
jgi:hypothetical protein